MRLFSLVSVIIFFIVEYLMLGKLWRAVDERLTSGQWTNNVLFRVDVNSEGATSTIMMLFATFFVLAIVMHWILSNSRSWRKTLEDVGIAWIVPAGLAVIGWLIPNVFVQVTIIVLQLSFIPLIPFVGQTVRLGHVLINWLVHILVAGLVFLIQRPSLEQLFQVERTDLLNRLEGYMDSGELERFERLLQKVDVAQLERLFDTVDVNQLERLLNRVDIDQLIRLLERVDLNQLERILNLFN